MAIQFPNYKYASLGNQEWLNGAASISFSLRVRVDAFTAAANQAYFCLNGPSGKFQVRKDGSTTKHRISVSTGGVFKTKDSTSTIVEDQTYHLAGIWKPDHATGLRLWVDGSEQGSGNSTVGQPDPFDGGGSPTLWLGCYAYDNSYAEATIEALLLARDYELSEEEIGELRRGAWPSSLPVGRATHAYYPLWPDLLTRFSDLSGAGRHIETIVGAVAADYLGQVDEPVPWGAPGGALIGSGGEEPPPDWTEWGETAPRDAPEIVISGLTNGQAYEFHLRAEDAAENLSQPSAVVEATPSASVLHVPRRVILYLP